MAVNFKTQHVISKAASRSYMIMNEFFEKSKHYSWKLGIYNTAWWIGFYCYPLNNCSFWGKRKITKWMDSYISKNKLVYPRFYNQLFQHLLTSIIYGCSGGKVKTVCQNWSRDVIHNYAPTTAMWC